MQGLLEADIDEIVRRHRRLAGGAAAAAELPAAAARVPAAQQALKERHLPDQHGPQRPERLSRRPSNMISWADRWYGVETVIARIRKGHALARACRSCASCYRRRRIPNPTLNCSL